jgi:putative ABC transport system ATP-binding protein
MSQPNGAPDAPLILLRHVHKGYPVGAVRHPALNGVDLQIESGAFAVLAGRSGSGKTTLLNLVAGLEVPDTGVVRVHGVDLHDKKAGFRTAFRLRHLGFVFQSYNLIPTLTAREAVAFVCQLQGRGVQACYRVADDWLHRVGLADMGDRRPDQMSGGQQQRVAVARALASEPDIVLADEPTANLDTATGRDLIGMLHGLNRDTGTTFLIASHDPAVIAAADLWIRLEDGRVTEIERCGDRPGDLAAPNLSSRPTPEVGP